MPDVLDGLTELWDEKDELVQFNTDWTYETQV
jgi:hypothetical protein